MLERPLTMVALLAAGAANAGPADDQVASGRTAFKACASCHQVGPSARSGFGPALNGIFGKAAGSRTDYRYSPAMKASKIVWSEQSLAAFIRDPGQAVPGTKMRFSSFGYSDRQLADLLAYLRTLPAIE